MKKLFTLGMMSALACANISAQTLTMIPVDEETLTTFMVQHISPNGKYLSGYAVSTGQPIVADWQNENIKVFEKVTGAETPWVNNDGMAVGYNRGGSVKLNFQTGEYEDIDPTDADGIRGVCEAMSEDGTVIVGAYIDTDWNETACYWENGLRKNLPMPTSEEMGFEVEGAHAKYISKDGSIIVGYLNMIPVLDPMVIWHRQADGTYQCNPVCKDWVKVNADDEKQANNLYKNFTPAGISPDGQFIAVNIRDYYSDDDWNWPDMKIGRYEVATGKLEVYGVEDFSCIAEAIANDGTIVGQTEGLDTYGMILRPGDDKPQAMYVVFGIDEFNYFDFYGGHEVKAISEDARYIAGVGPVMGETIFPSGRDAYVLDTKGETTAIITVNKGERSKAAYYTVDGRKSNAPVKGLNIVKTTAGQTKKVLVK